MTVKGREASSALRAETRGGRQLFWTRSLGGPSPITGERSRVADGAVWRVLEPSRSKLAAALALGLKAPPLLPGENVLYLGAATGTTASHVADLVGPQGIVYAVEKSPRAFARLLASAGRWPNLAPLLRDVREPESYVGLVPMVGALYMDIPQPDQVEIALRNASLFLRPGGRLYLALKLSSLGRARTPKEHLEAAVRELREHFQLDAPIPLEPFYRRHAFIAGRSRA